MGLECSVVIDIVIGIIIVIILDLIDIDVYDILRTIFVLLKYPTLIQIL